MWQEERNGKTVFRERIIDEVTGKMIKFSVTAKKETAAGKREAVQKLYKKVRDHQAAGNDIRLGEMIELYLQDQLQTVKPSTYRRNKASLGMIETFFDDPIVNKTTAGYLRKGFLETGKAPDTLNEYIRRLGSAWRWAYRNGYVNSTSAIDQLGSFKVPPHREKIKDKYLEASDAMKVIEALPDAWALVMRLQVLSGLRFGELAALDKSDVNIKEKYIDVYKNQDAATGKISDVKTQTSIRRVHMNPDLIALAKEINRFSDFRRKLNNSKCPAFFINHEGKRIQIAAFNKELKKTTKKVLGRSLTSHALRHTFASLALENGIELDTIMRTLGHSNSKTLKDIYLHVTEELRKKDADALDGVSFFK